MNKVDIIRKYVGNYDFYDMNGTLMLTNILKAMEEYKEQQVKNCSIPDVVGQSEQLKMLEHIRHIKGLPLDVQKTIDKMYLSHL